jgi:hypothetical protein
MRTSEIDKALEKTISVKRLDKYLSVMNSDLDKSLKLYEENMRLAEAFYTPLQCLEVCFRNTLNLRLSATYGADWLTNGRTPLEAGFIKTIGDVVSDLAKGGHSNNPDDVVAELNFGFWVGLIGPSYGPLSTVVSTRFADFEIALLTMSQFSTGLLLKCTPR